MSSATRASKLIFCLVLMELAAVTTPSSPGDLPKPVCKKEQFGSKCQFKCNCNESRCNSTDGECLESACKPGMFGLACQYEDLLHSHMLNTSNPKLTDQDDASCIDGQSSDSPTEAVFTLKEEFPLFWIRLGIKEIYDVGSANLKDLNVTLNDNLTCHVKLFKVDDHNYDMFCSGVHFVTKLSLKGELVKNLCTVRFSGGRNIAVNGKPTQSSNKTGYSPEKAIDGTRDEAYLSEENCISTADDPSDLSPVWNVTFAQPTVVFRMVFHTHVGTPHKEITIIQWDAHGKEINLFNISTNTTNVTMLAKQFLFTKKVSVYGGSPPLSFCELEIWGDSYCVAANTWGMVCERKCDCGPNNTYCFTNSEGRCVEFCPHGFYGMGCTSRCPSQCPGQACHYHTGGCFTCPLGITGELCNTPCDTHHFGANCEQMCSKNCLGGTCDSMSGNCTCTGVFTGPTCNECPHSFYGPLCKRKCSHFCVKQECNRNTGKCFQCREGFTGFNCSVCPPFKYGENCSSQCSEACYLTKCNSFNGTCHSCSPGLTGDYCQLKYKDLDTGRSGLFLLAVGFGIAVLVTILFSIFLCKQRQLKKKDITNSIVSEELN